MARLFDNGSSEYLEKDVAPVTDYPLTLACWFYSDTITLSQTLVGIIYKDGPDDRLAGLQARGSTAGDPIHAVVRRDTIAAAETTTGYSVNTWHHAAGTFTSTTARAAFIDGGSKGTDTTSIVPANENRISIGRWGDSTPGNYMSGRICEVGLWDVVLTDDEISALARGVTPNRVRPANLKGYWPVWGLHSPEIDLSGNGNSLAVTGAVKADHAPVTLYTPKWAASVPLVEADAGGGFAHSQAVIVA